ncbi:MULTISPECIES: dihydropteroate synthase [unclassified Streptomyces]|uniref:dihydropteroate synthase n=1 Tax=unclassified Streptomyces TaxID=2593676 RepID=UPI00168BB60A|nr:MULTISPECIES: dihydropteroate synthase [unclassified Streptomyces]MBD3004445.1 dihydropteroate synthase [Streptomyces sp. 5-10]
MSTLRGRGRVAGLPEWDRCAVMGVVNVTPDSFSDGGKWFDTDLAVKHGLDLVAAGADLVDVGGESTRPGAARVDEAEELRRVIPVVRELAAAGALISVDTMRAAVAERAVAAGARLVNDVSGGGADPAMVPMVAAAGVPFVVMHWRGQSIDMNNRAVYADVVGEVVAELRAGLERAVAGGIDPERIVVDPGLGFAKDAGHDLALVARLSALRELGRPLLVAASRKRFLGRVLAGDGGSPPPARERDAATAAVTAIAAREGAWAVRVHEVRASADAVRVARAIEAAETTAGAL